MVALELLVINEAFIQNGIQCVGGNRAVTWMCTSTTVAAQKKNHIKILYRKFKIIEEVSCLSEIIYKLTNVEFLKEKKKKNSYQSCRH